jgi:hypothetical protein
MKLLFPCFEDVASEIDAKHRQLDCQWPKPDHRTQQYNDQLERLVDGIKRELRDAKTKNVIRFEIPTHFRWDIKLVVLNQIIRDFSTTARVFGLWPDPRGGYGFWKFIAPHKKFPTFRTQCGDTDIYMFAIEYQNGSANQFNNTTCVVPANVIEQ